MIGANHVDRAILESGDDGIHVILCPQGWIHLGAGVEITAGFLSQGEIVWAGLTSHFHTTSLSLADQFDRAGCAQMGQMDRQTNIFGNQNIPGNHDLLSNGRDTPQTELETDQPFIHVATLCQ